MIYVECEQGTAEWHLARCGVITASMFSTALTTRTKPPGPSQAALDYSVAVALERIAQAPLNGAEAFNNWQMKRGQVEEPFGREHYEVDTGRVVRTAGICLTDCRKFGYSTDGLVDDDGLIEIKSLVAPWKLVQLWRTHDLSEWIHQIQGGMWITGRQWCDFICWAPQLRSVGKEIYVRRVHRDNAFINQMELDLCRFEALVSETEALMRSEIEIPA